MEGLIEGRVELNQVTHSVRAAQAVLQYGVGDMVDFPDQTLVTAAPEYWSAKRRIFDDRLAKALNVDYFALPVNIAYVRFPEWYFCPKCRRFQPLSKWITEYQETERPKKNRGKLDKDENMVKHVKCPKCEQDLVVARIVTVCEDGHLNDFPWVKWVHAKAKKSICKNPSLMIKTVASGSEGLEGLSIVCSSCEAQTTLKGAFGTDVFKSMGCDFKCEGHHPFKHTREKCQKYPKTVQRGASSVYFPVTISSLVIPPYANRLNTKIKKSNAYGDCIAILDDCETSEERLLKAEEKLPKWAGKIATEIGVSPSDVETILKEIWLNPTSGVTDVSSVNYRFEEYMALTGEISTPKEDVGDFSREAMPVDEYKIPHLKSVVLVDKVRVVHALTGFSRINPVMGKQDAGFVSVKEFSTRWYPAYEVRGEGIFIEFSSEDIEKWVQDNPDVSRRAEQLQKNYSEESFSGKNHPRMITPKFIMLHTISHLLINQLSFECGYSIASLSERLYCSEPSEGKEMAGILIYTACGDSEGTLGGLVRQGRSDTFPQIFKKAVNSARTCSNDPVCIMSRGQGHDSLNLAACHACALLPETCCEERNAFLDRGMIIGTFENRNIGFWSDWH